MRSWVYCLFFTFFVAAHSAGSALIDLDWALQGDSSLTLDTSTGLLWLDLSVTADQSYDQVAAQLKPGGAYHGFRYATHGEVLRLWSEAAITDTGFAWVENGEWARVKELADRLGTSPLFDPDGIGTHALGMVEQGPALPANERWVPELSYHSDGVRVRTSSIHYTLETSFHSIHYSSFLVSHVTEHQALEKIITLGPLKDNTLYQDVSGSLSNGAGENLFVGRTNQEPGLSLRRGLIAFDIAGSVPLGSTIRSGLLVLHLSQTGDPTSLNSIGLHRLLTDWGESDSDAPGSEGSGTAAAMGDATWLHTFYDTDLWPNEGGDFDPAPSAVHSADAVGEQAWGPTPGMGNDLQLWLDSPSSNFGWALVGNEIDPGIVKRFDTREDPTPSNRPVLWVFYTPPPGYQDGDLNESGTVDLADVFLTIRIAAGLVTPTRLHLYHGDVAPMGAPDGVMDLADVMLVMQKAAGLISF